MKKLIVWPYKMGSQSAKALARELEVKRVYPNRNYRPKENHIIINWGNGSYPGWRTPWAESQMLNRPEAIAKASDKLETFRALEGEVNVPQFTTEQDLASDWLWGNTDKVYCRQLLQGHSGRGIVVARSVDELVPAPLYTVGISVMGEFRVHVFKGEVFDYAQKKKMRHEVLEERGLTYNSDVRSHLNGWVFARTDIELPGVLREVAIEAVEVLWLDFAAVDCVIDGEGKGYVLEVNTAPGLEGQTLERYTNKFRDYIS
jgi:predicted ATP-grasp superfamily ATP-dependent carboligase